MIADLKPYPGVKNFSVPWLDGVPEHWAAPRLKTVFREVDHRSGTGQEPLLSLRMQRGLVDHHAEGGKLIPPSSLVKYKRTQPGEIVMNRMRAASGLFATTPMIGLVSPDYAVLRPRRPVNLQYFVHLFRTPIMMSVFRLESRGLGTGQSGFLRLYTERFGMLTAPLPPLAEQHSIVRFLDHYDRKIRRYIRAKQKLIKLLEEQKQAIIHRAVTRGLDPNVRLKPSGVEWLGEVPEHWEVLPLKRWVSTKITDGPHETPEWLENGVPFLSAEAMVGGRLDFNRRRGFISRGLHDVYCRKCRPQRDDIFMCKSGATTGKVAIVEVDDDFSVWSPLALIRVRRSRVLPRMLFAVLQSRYVQRQVQDTWSYGTQPNLSMGAMERLFVALPSRDEQANLLVHINEETKLPTEAIHRANREIDLLREYRTRLIADVVTGKLDVREAAANLSDEEDAPEVLDEADAMDENGEEAGETDEEAADGENGE